MQDKPNPNPTEPKKEIRPVPASAGGDFIVIGRDVGVGANVGSGHVQADAIAQGDIVINNGLAGQDTAQFVEMLHDLRVLLQQAQDKGELNPSLAKQAIHNVDSAAQMVGQDKKPPKSELIKRLESVVQVIDAGLEMVTQQGTIGSLLLKALPVAVMLLKLATKIF